MSDFDKIIKEKVDQFEVPYNDAHWAAMESKLDTIKATKIKTNIFSAAAVVTILSIGAYLIFGGTTKRTTENTITENNTVVENTSNTNKLNTYSNNVTENATKTNNINTKNNNSNNQEHIEDNLAVVENTENQESSNEVLDNNNNSETQNTISPTKNIKLNAEFIVYNNKICLGEVVSFESVENERPVSYLWNFGDGNVSHKTNPKYEYKNPGTYDVTLTLIDIQSGTEHTTKQRDVVTILDKPNASFSYLEESVKHDDNKLKYPYTTFKVKNHKKGNTYEWSLGNGETSNALTAKTIHEKADNYLIKLAVTNDEGCTAELDKNIKVKNNFILYAPTAIRQTPDNPENGIFMPKALLEWDIPFEMVITNKSGRTIYKTSDKNEGWNGKLNNTGRQMEEGFYFWKIITKDAENKPHYHQGEIQLVK